MKKTLTIILILISMKAWASDYVQIPVTPGRAQRILHEIPIPVGGEWKPTPAQCLAAGWRVLPERAPVPVGHNVLRRWFEQHPDNELWAVEKLITKSAAKMDQEQTDRESNIDNAERILRALELAVLAKFNRHRAWMMAYKQAVADATTLAGLKVAVAAMDNLPQVSEEQMKTVIENKAQGL